MQISRFAGEKDLKEQYRRKNEKVKKSMQDSKEKNII